MLHELFLQDYPELALQGYQFSAQGLTLTLVTTPKAARCPQCQQLAQRVHSRHWRQVADVPCLGRTVQWTLKARRFFCDNPACPKTTFAERLPAMVAVWGRRSQRLVATQQRLGFALGGEAGARLAAQLGMTTSPDTLLRLVRRASATAPPTVRVLGIDDWAWRRGQRYGTVLVDLEQHRPIDLLQDRDADSVAAWLKMHPEIEIIVRDRASVYAEGAMAGAPQARQVADRYHLLLNLHEALVRFFERHTAELKQVQLTRELPPPSATPEKIADTPPEAPRLKRRPLKANSQVLAQRAGRQAQSQARFAQVQALFQQGQSQRAIARTLKLNRATVGRWLAAGAPPRRSPMPSQSPVAAWGDYLQARWQAGCRSPRQLWQELQAQGYTGSEAAVWRWLLRLREAEAAGTPVLDNYPRLGPTTQTYTLSARQAAWVLTRPPEALKPMEQEWLTQMQARCPLVQAGHTLAQQFSQMVKTKSATNLNAWLQAAEASGLRELQNFAVGLSREYDLIEAALTLPWSAGQTEGQVHRLKLIKRQMYGRAKFDLLRQRVLHRG